MDRDLGLVEYPENKPKAPTHQPVMAIAVNLEDFNKTLKHSIQEPFLKPGKRRKNELTK